MGVSTRLGPIVILQDAVSAAANGALLDITDATSAVLEVSGGWSGMTVTFQASIDTGQTWLAVSCTQMESAPTLTRTASATNNGLYFLEFARPLNAVRAKVIASGTPTGALTVRARAALA